MNTTRRHYIQLAGVLSVTGLAGCVGIDSPDSQEPSIEYTLAIQPVDENPIDAALYATPEEQLFGEPARTALKEILPEGEFRTDGYAPLPAEVYVSHQDTYYKTAVRTDGSTQRERTIVRLTSPPEATTQDDVLAIDSLDAPSTRALKILDRSLQSETFSLPEPLHEGGYVLRRPAERESDLGTEPLDGKVVEFTEPNRHQIEISSETLREPVYVTDAFEVAASRSAFQTLVFETRIDAGIGAQTLDSESRRLLDRAIGTGEIKETEPRSQPFQRLLEALNVGDVERTINGQLLWYDTNLYRYGLYINTHN